MFNETNSSRSIKETILKNIYHKEAVVKEIENLRKKSNTVCTKPKRKGDKIHHLIRHPRDTTSVYDKLGTQSAVYFSGKEILKLKAFYSKIPSGSFTLSLLLNPEGGQHDPVTILGKKVVLIIWFSQLINRITSLLNTSIINFIKSAITYDFCLICNYHTYIIKIKKCVLRNVKLKFSILMKSDLFYNRYEKNNYKNKRIQSSLLRKCMK